MSSAYLLACVSCRHRDPSGAANIFFDLARWRGHTVVTTLTGALAPVAVAAALAAHKPECILFDAVGMYPTTVRHYAAALCDAFPGVGLGIITTHLDPEMCVKVSGYGVALYPQLLSFIPLEELLEQTATRAGLRARAVTRHATTAHEVTNA